ncbi:substrate-binding domain-containing protein [Clostridium lacusfryxellense]|uniref:substrate-binding domain-containing protein n=1 Tax=Clostridium lacusfryxellense TaxID=205328 RepID=UPI001C0C2788|nr:substrate-binding domain-containing protein [Clostridium lacusfryxellense]MBU3113271.1 substrate-binding domain-containing protein [Clostridium lacusfryxellense]
MSKRITMQDVANKVGVSKVTVSKALTGKGEISESMREKIKQVAKELGYLYNHTGKNLGNSLTRSIGIITSERYFGQDANFYIDMYKMISDELENLNYTTILHILSPENEKNSIIPRMILEQKIEGVIILGQLARDYLKKINQYQFPMVFLDFYYNNFDVDSVITDNFFSAYEITSYLIENGHRNIGYVGNIKLTSSIQDRYLGYYKSMLEYDLEIKPQWIISDKDDDGEWKEIELPKEIPTAFVCNCDIAANNLIEKLKASGYNVPEDCSVVGFDDSIHATLSIPQITTIRVNLQELSKVAIKKIIKRIKDFHRYSSRVMVKTKLIKRDSVIKIL